METIVIDRGRYARHLVLPEVGAEGQRRIRAARVLCVGAGGLGSPVALYLAAAGIGSLGLVDCDRVELSNLQRQILHGTPDVGRPKTDSAAARIKELNPDVEVNPHPVRLTRENALDLISGYDVVVDGTDNFPTRYLANDACALLGKPLVYGSISRFEGQASLFAPHLGGPCYRCLFPEPPAPGTTPGCAEGGVLGVLPGVIGTIQATETLKLLLGRGRSLLGRLLVYDALEMSFRELKLRRDPQCPLCGGSPSITKLIDYHEFCGVPAEPPLKTMNPDEVTVQDLKHALDNPALGIQVIDVREEDEHRAASIPGAKLLPLSQLAARYGEVERDRMCYLHCQAGVRSMRALQFLRQQGFSKLKSVKGGYLAWAAEIG